MNQFLIRLSSLVLPLVILLSACSQSQEDRILDLGRCRKAGTALGDGVLLQGVNIELAKATRDMQPGMGTARFAMAINEKLNDELYPQGTSTNLADQMETLNKWAASSVCKKLKEEAIDARKQ